MAEGTRPAQAQDKQDPNKEEKARVAESPTPSLEVIRNW